MGTINCTPTFTNKMIYIAKGIIMKLGAKSHFENEPQANYCKIIYRDIFIPK